MPTLITLRMRLPVCPFQSPLRTRSANSLIRSSTACTSGTTSCPSTTIDAPRGARSATCSTARFSETLMRSPAEHRIDALAQSARLCQLPQQAKGLVGRRGSSHSRSRCPPLRRQGVRRAPDPARTVHAACANAFARSARASACHAGSAVSEALARRHLERRLRAGSRPTGGPAAADGSPTAGIHPGTHCVFADATARRQFLEVAHVAAAQHDVLRLAVPRQGARSRPSTFLRHLRLPSRSSARSPT